MAVVLRFRSDDSSNPLHINFDHPCTQYTIYSLYTNTVQIATDIMVRNYVNPINFHDTI